jgi:hypothetical protein
MYKISILFIILIVVSCGGSKELTTFNIGSSYTYNNSDSVCVTDNFDRKIVESYEKYDVKAGATSQDNVLMKETDTFITETNKNKTGTLVYKIDSSLIIGTVSKVEARIIKQVSDNVTNYLISLTTHTTIGVIKKEIIKVGEIMSMELISLENGAFTINNITSNEQMVDNKEATLWLWSITPNKIGNYNLILKAKIKNSGVSKDLIIFDKTIKVINKPKNKYLMTVIIPDKLKRYEENIIRLELTVNNENPSIEWGGYGKVILDFDGDVVIITNDECVINDNKSKFSYKWIVKPNKNNILNYTFKILGDYNDTIIYANKISVKNDFRKPFNIFIDNAVKRWYWIFMTLLIPLFNYIKNKYFKKKRKKGK